MADATNFYVWTPDDMRRILDDLLVKYETHSRPWSMPSLIEHQQRIITRLDALIALLDHRIEGGER
jgi:hypothetical protein